MLEPLKGVAAGLSIYGGALYATNYFLRNPITTPQALMFVVCNAILNGTIIDSVLNILDKKKIVNLNNNIVSFCAFAVSQFAIAFFSQQIFSTLGLAMGYGTALSLTIVPLAVLFAANMIYDKVAEKAKPDTVSV